MSDGDYLVRDGMFVPVRAVAKDISQQKQIGGDHYRQHPLQPWDIIAMFGLDFWVGNVLKYLLRWRKKGGVEDLRKARHYIEYLIERECRK